MHTLHHLRVWLRPHWGRVGISTCLAGLACLLNVPTPLLIQGLVDGVVAGRRAAIPLFALGLLAVFAGQASISLGNAFCIGRVGLEVVRELRHRLYARLQLVGLSFFEQTPSGAILSRVMDDVAAVHTLVSGQSMTVLVDIGTTLVVSALLAWQSPRLFLVALAVLPILVGCFRHFGRGIRAGHAAVRAQMDTIFGHLKTKFDGVLVIKAYAREQAEIDEFSAHMEAVHIPRVRVERMHATLSNLSLAASGIGASLVFAVGALEVLAGRLTPGELVSAGALAGLLFGPASRLADFSVVFHQAAASIERLAEILEHQADVIEPAQPLSLGRAHGLVEFDRVGFGYREGHPVLWDVRLRVEPGMRVALVGPTGCGKTTLLNLLFRFYDPTWGEIRLDGAPINQLLLAELRRQIGVVPQEAVIFRRSLADNIRYGAPEANMAQVEAAARAALVHDFAMQLPEAYDTIVGEGAYKLSQGERQRVAIARAICKDPALIVLDEATSSLDTAGEALIQQAMANLLKGRTAFIIAHRLVTVLDADRIVVMDGGEIVQIGTHAELLADEDGLYRQLCQRQFDLPELRPFAPTAHITLAQRPERLTA